MASHNERLIFPWPFDRPKPGRRSTWKVLFRHFRKYLLKPAGVETNRGVLTRIFRRTAGTWVEKLGGSGKTLLGHKTSNVFETFYQDQSQKPVTVDACLIPEDRPPAPPPGKQMTLFVSEEKT